MKPTILIINGLLQYQTAVGLPTPTTPLANDLRAAGFRVVEDSHLLFSHGDEEPIVIIAHSRGGGTAMRLAARLKEQAKFNPIIITFDAVPVQKCPVARCINFQSKEYKALAIPGAQNIDANLPFLPLVAHSYLPASPHVRGRVLAIVRPLAKEMH